MPRKLETLAEFESAAWVSCKTGRGLELLRQRLAEIVTAELDSMQANIFVNQQCQNSLVQTEQALVRAIDSTAHGAGHEIVAADIREAVDAMGVVTGQIYTEDLLGRIFSRFCIGK